MSFISSIRYIKPDDHRAFVAERLKALKTQLDEDIQSRVGEGSLRLATWNIMHFSDGGAYDRTTESLLYIAEIIDHFDLVAIQEVNHDLKKFELLMQRYLGGDWDYILTDASGNRERLAKLGPIVDEALVALDTSVLLSSPHVPAEVLASASVVID